MRQKTGPKPLGRMSFKDAAFRLMKKAKAPLHYKTITEDALSKKWIDTEGKTPSQTMLFVIRREMKRRDSLFVGKGLGIYGLSRRGQRLKLGPLPRKR